MLCMGRWAGRWVVYLGVDEIALDRSLHFANQECGELGHVGEGGGGGGGGFSQDGLDLWRVGGWVGG